ncbi:MAG: hypothetical protein Q9170_002548 [Blastenia crenularia]
MDKAALPQANAGATPCRGSSFPTPPQESLAGMTIEDRGADGQTSRERSQWFDRYTSDGAPVQNSPAIGPTQAQSADRMFFMDDVGSPVFFSKKHAPPTMSHSRSPTGSESSEEVIVFTGRKHVPSNSFPDQKPAVCKPSSNSDRHTPTNDKKFGTTAPATAHYSITNVATQDEIQASIKATEGVPHPENSTEDLNGQVRKSPTRPLKLSQRAFRERRNSKRSTRLLAEEDEILADYIQHMDSEEKLDTTPRKAARNSAPRSNPFARFCSQLTTDGKGEQDATHRMLSGSLESDSYLVPDVNSDSGLDSPSDEDTAESINDAQITMDVQNYMDDLEDEKDLLERKQARMTDEQIARLLSKQEELGLSSSELLLFDGNDPEDIASLSEEQEDFVFSANIKSTRKARNRERHQSRALFSPATLVADALGRYSDGDFDVMDHDRPSLKVKSKSRHAPSFELSDAELEASLLLAWEMDRSKKKVRRKEREELRAKGFLAGQDQGNLKAQYCEGISFGEVKDELIKFMVSAKQR